ncbi:RDD family protein [Candidatus Izimaplasma bacterium HR1]|jgi:uncharacterized RDD family membrane protein YckC|uniref:RDD family protein n=1 Tax=Candidatus Izimoplasma sp. HR1 TaxID=1541959 RepID=UPI0004F8261D|nr:RDD family protein [Candidatus Izimaplasma bacterium HR1]
MNYETKLGIRVGAFILDMLVISAISSLLTNLGLGVEYEVFPGVVIKDLTIWQSFLLYAIYFVGFAVFNNGITVGKMVTNLKVKDVGYNELPQNKIIFRETIKAILMPISFISFIVAVLREDNKSIHDMIFDTVVVKEVKDIQDPYNIKGKRDIKSVFKENTFEDYQKSNQKAQPRKSERQFNVPDDEYYDDPADNDVTPDNEDDNYYQ